MPSHTTTTECPPAADLERLIRGRLTEARASAIAEHVGACSGCQERLDAISGAAEGIASNLRECTRAMPPSDSAYYRALEAAEEEVRATAAFLNGSADTQPVVDDKLDFLQPTDEPDRLGKLGTFSVIRLVGRGGMGVVLHAYDPCLTRDVAIKVIDPKLAHNEVARQRFCREARAAAAVTHDNLVAVHQVDEDEFSGLPYLVMQLVQGESLEQRLKRSGKLTPVEVARMGMQAAAGLAAAHAGGLIHRDIKPANILLEAPVDRVKLTDFGLARAAEDVKLTRTGFVAGSPLYMAPEQARGDEVDHRADLFSLGSVLYEAAAGTPAFDGKTPLAVLRRVADETPVALHRVNADIPEWLSDIVNRLLAKNPADRYQSASEVAEVFAVELARWHALSPLDVPADVCPGTSGTRLTTARAHKQICWKAVAFSILPWLGGAVLGALALWLLWTPGVVEKVVQVPVEVVGRPAAPAPAGPPPRIVFEGNSGAIWAITFLDNDRLVIGMEDGNVKIWNFRTNTIQKTLEPRQGGTIWSADVSGDGKYLVTPCDDSKVTVWNLEDYTTPYSFPQPTSTKAAVFSPDDKHRLATGDRNATIRIWNLEAQIPIELSGHRGTVHALAYSLDGQRLASAGSDGTAKVWDLRNVDWNRRNNDVTAINLAEHRGAVYGVTFCPGCKLVATTGWDGTVRLWDAATGEHRLEIEAHEGDAWSVSFGNEGKWVASAGQDAVKVFEVATGKEIFSYRGGRAFHVVRFAKNGTTLAAGGRDGTVKVWELPR
jgi:serine/threonine protein kinase/outer membrane protein assembly factor BamB